MNDDPVTWESLATAFGASVAAGMVVKTIGTFRDRTDKQPQQIAIVASIVIVQVAVIALNGLAWGVMALGLLVGMQGGLAAAKVVSR